MPWRPNGKRLRALREQRGWTLEELASRSGVSDRQIRAIESTRPPKTIQMRTIRDLSGALKCEREQIATWVEHEITAEPEPKAAPAPAHVAVQKNSEPPKAKRGQKKKAEHEPEARDPEVVERGKLPRASTLARRAAMERQAKIAARSLACADGAAVEVIGFDRLYELDTAFAASERERFGVEGAVAEHRAIPRYVEPILDVKSGVGAQFLLVRKVAREPLYLSVFTRSPDHTKKLIEAERAARPVSAIVRVVVARPHGEWKGFFIFEKQPRPHPWALLIEELIT